VRIIRLPPWAAALLGVGVLSLTLALLVLAASAALILLPILALGGVVYGWWMRRQIARGRATWPGYDPRGPARDGTIIEGEYVVIEPPQSDRGDSNDKGRGRSEGR
jgi:hypothetical protein